MRPAASTARFKLRAWSVLLTATAILSVTSARVGSAQSVPYQRAFPQSRAMVEKQLKQMQSSSAGNLPALEGFAVAGDRPLDRFRRGYYQCTAQVSSSPSGGSMVRVNATITAWYNDPLRENRVTRFFPPMAGWRPISSTAWRKHWATRDRRRAPRRGRTFHPPPPGVRPIRREQLRTAAACRPRHGIQTVRPVRPSTWETR